MNITEIQKGWRYYSSDFSLDDGSPGSVTLCRDRTNKEKWHHLASIEPDEGKWPALYVSGRGMTLASAIENANKSALANGSELPTLAEFISAKKEAAK